MIHLPVSLPKCLFGFKETRTGLTKEALIRRDIVTKLGLDLLFGSSTKLYQKLYDAGLISDGFGHEYNSNPNYGFSAIGGDTKDPEALLSIVKQEISQVLEVGIASEDFERARKKKIGGYLRMLNSPESIAHEFTRYAFRGGDLFSVIKIYESITMQEVNDRLHEHIDWAQVSVSLVESP